MINDKKAKASTNVKVGDIIEITFGNRTVKAEVLSTPEVLKKDDAEGMYKYV